MATRFWLTSSAPPYTPTTRRGAWDTATGEDVQLLGRKPAGTAGTSTINVGSTAADRDVLLHRSISAGAVKAGTLSGTVTWMIGARESNAALNGVFHVHIYVTTGDSDTPRGTLLTDYIGNVATSEFGTTSIGATEGAQTVTPVALSVGDRLVVEIGYRANAGATTQNATINYGNTGTTDLSLASASVTTQPGWVDFSGAGGLFTQAMSTLTDTFTSSIDSKWTASAGVAATGGRARIDCTTATPNMRTSGAYEIQNSTLTFKVPAVPVTGGGSTVKFSGYLMPGPTSSSTNLAFEYSPNTGNLVLKNNVGGTDASPTTLTYSSTDHLWWRFRETSGTILMETSPDNSTWTTRRTISTMSQWMLYGTHIAYFDATRASGSADFAEIDDINPGGTVQVVTLASSTETAQAVAKAKTKAVPVAAASEAAQPLARLKRLTLGIATESNTSQAVGHTRQRALSPAAGVDAAQTIGRVKTLATAAASAVDGAQALGITRGATIGVAAEAGAAQPLAAAKRLALAPAAGVETAQQVSLLKTLALGVATEAGTTLAIAAAKTLTLTVATETSTAQSLTAVRALTLSHASSADAAQTITPTKALALAPATETGTVTTVVPAKSLAITPAVETAEAPTLSGSGTLPLTGAQETGAAQPITASKTLALQPAAESSAAQQAAASKRVALAPALGTSSAQAVGALKVAALGPANETGTALAFTADQPHPIEPAEAVETAQPVPARKTLALGPAFDYGTAMPAGRAKTKTLTYATETGIPQTVQPGHRLTLTPAVETSTTLAADPTKRQLIAAATETATAQTITTPGAGLSHGIRLTGTRTTWTAPNPPTTTWASHTTDTAWTCTRNEVPVNSLTTEFHEVGVTWTHGDPTEHTVQMAVIPHGHDPDDADWHTAAWDTDADGLPVAKLLVGPDGGAVDPGPGRFRDWVSIDAPPEHPVLATPPYDIT